MSKPILPPVPSEPIRVSIPSSMRVAQLPLNVQNPLPVRTNPNVNPYSASPYQRARVGATLSAMPMAEGGVSVADMVRAQKDGYLTSDGFQISGPNYTQSIRKDAAGDLYIAPPSMPTAGYAANSYPYPSSKMKVGAALAAAPFPGGQTPAWVKQSKYYIPESPAQHRKSQMATLMGLGAIKEDILDLSTVGDEDSRKAARALAITGNVDTSRIGDGAQQYDYIGVFGSPGSVFTVNDADAALMSVSKDVLKKWVKILRVIEAWRGLGVEELGQVTNPGALALAWGAASKWQTSVTIRDRMKKNIESILLGKPPEGDDIAFSLNLADYQRYMDEARKLVGDIKDLTGGSGGDAGGSGGGPTPCQLNPNQPGCPGYKEDDKKTEEESNPWLWPAVGVAGLVVLVLAIRARRQ